MAKKGIKVTVIGNKIDPDNSRIWIKRSRILEVASRKKGCRLVLRGDRDTSYEQTVEEDFVTVIHMLESE